jgi:uncharacterized protein YacL
METFMANTVLFAQLIPQRILDIYPPGADTNWINNPAMDWIGIWIAALLTFAMYSFLYKDNVVYKFAEHLYIGISVGYFICITWFNVMKPNLFDPLFTDFSYNKILIIPALFGITMLFRLSRQYSWVSRYGLVYMVASGAGLAIPVLIQAMILRHMSSTFVPIWGGETEYAFLAIFSNVVIIVGVLSVLIYFFFSLEHKGAVGKISQVGIMYLMITFGTAFGYTVMARISLLIGRMQFLLEQWLGRQLG